MGTKRTLILAMKQRQLEIAATNYEERELGKINTHRSYSKQVRQKDKANKPG